MSDNMSVVRPQLDNFKSIKVILILKNVMALDCLQNRNLLSMFSFYYLKWGLKHPFLLRQWL